MKCPRGDCDSTLLVIRQCLLKYWLGGAMKQTITWTNIGHVQWHHMPSLEHKDLKCVESKKSSILLNKLVDVFRLTKELCSREWHIIALIRQWHFNLNMISILLHIISIWYWQSTDWCRYRYPQNLMNVNIFNTTRRYLGKYIDMNAPSKIYVKAKHISPQWSAVCI